jgi:periodic tryptophan protein 2
VLQVLQFDAIIKVLGLQLALHVTFRPDGKEIAVATLDGNISLWHLDSLTEVGNIECQRDAAIGRGLRDRESYFTSLCYSQDGSCLLAGGKSMFVCLYNVHEKALLKKFQLSKSSPVETSTVFYCSKPCLIKQSLSYIY